MTTKNFTWYFICVSFNAANVYPEKKLRSNEAGLFYSLFCAEVMLSADLFLCHFVYGTFLLAFLQSIISFAVAMPYKIHFKYCSFQYILPLCVFVGSELEKYHTDAAKTICSYSYLVTIFRSYLLHVSKFLVVLIRVSYYNCKNVVMVLVKWNQISTLVTLVAKSMRWECKLNLTTNSRQKQG